MDETKLLDLFVRIGYINKEQAREALVKKREKRKYHKYSYKTGIFG